MEIKYSIGQGYKSTSNIKLVPMEVTHLQFGEVVDTFCQPELTGLKYIQANHIDVLVINSEFLTGVWNSEAVQCKNVTSLVFQCCGSNFNNITNNLVQNNTKYVMLLSAVDDRVLQMIKCSKLKSVFIPSTSVGDAQAAALSSCNVVRLERRWCFIKHDDKVTISGPIPVTVDEFSNWLSCAVAIGINNFLFADQMYKIDQLSFVFADTFGVARPQQILEKRELDRLAEVIQMKQIEINDTQVVLNRTMSINNEQIAEMEHENRTLQDQLVVKQQIIESISTEYNAIQSQLMLQNSNTEKLNAVIQQLNRTIADLSAQLNRQQIDYKTSYDELQYQLSIKDSAIQKLNSNIALKTETLRSSAKQMADLQFQLSTSQSLKQSMRNELNVTNTMLQRQKDENKLQAQDIIRMKEQYSQLLAAQNFQKISSDQLKGTQNNTAATEVLKSGVTNNDREVEALKSEVQTLKSDVVNLQRQQIEAYQEMRSGSQPSIPKLLLCETCGVYVNTAQEMAMHQTVHENWFMKDSGFM